MVKNLSKHLLVTVLAIFSVFLLTACFGSSAPVYDNTVIVQETPANMEIVYNAFAMYSDDKVDDTYIADRSQPVEIRIELQSGYELGDFQILVNGSAIELTMSDTSSRVYLGSFYGVEGENKITYQGEIRLKSYSFGLYQADQSANEFSEEQIALADQYFQIGISNELVTAEMLASANMEEIAVDGMYNLSPSQLQALLAVDGGIESTIQYGNEFKINVQMTKLLNYNKIITYRKAEEIQGQLYYTYFDQLLYRQSDFSENGRTLNINVEIDGTFDLYFDYASLVQSANQSDLNTVITLNDNTNVTSSLFDYMFNTISPSDTSCNDVQYQNAIVIPGSSLNTEGKQTLRLTIKDGVATGVSNAVKNAVDNGKFGLKIYNNRGNEVDVKVITYNESGYYEVNNIECPWVYGKFDNTSYIFELVVIDDKVSVEEYLYQNAKDDIVRVTTKDGDVFRFCKSDMHSYLLPVNPRVSYSIDYYYGFSDDRVAVNIVTDRDCYIVYIVTNGEMIGFESSNPNVNESVYNETLGLYLTKENGRYFLYATKTIDLSDITFETDYYE